MALTNPTFKSTRIGGVNTHVAILQPKTLKTHFIRVCKLKKICHLATIRLHILFKGCKEKKLFFNLVVVGEEKKRVEGK